MALTLVRNNERNRAKERRGQTAQLQRTVSSTDPTLCSDYDSANGEKTREHFCVMDHRQLSLGSYDLSKGHIVLDFSVHVI